MTHTLIITSQSGSILTPVKTKEDGEKIKNKLIKHLRTKTDPVFEFEYDGDTAAVVVANISGVFVQPDEKYRQFVYERRRDQAYMDQSIHDEITKTTETTDIPVNYLKQLDELVHLEQLKELINELVEDKTLNKKTLKEVHDRLCTLNKMLSEQDQYKYGAQIQYIFDALIGDETR